MAGCGGFAGSPGSAPTPTVSPAPVPTVASDVPADRATDGSLRETDPTIPAPGVSIVAGDVRVNASRLGRAHERALDRAGSYRRTVVVTLRTEDGTVVAEDRERVLADRGAGRYLVVETPRLAPGPFDEPVGYERFLANGTRHTYRRFANGTTRIDRSTVPGPPRGRWRVDGRELAAFLARGDLRLASRGDAGAPDRYVLVGRFPDPPSVGLVSDTAGGRITASVRADGLVEEIRLSYRARSGRQPVAVALAVGHDRLGATTVERPAWLDGRGTDGTRTGNRTPARAASDGGKARNESTGGADQSARSPPPSSSSRVRRWR